MPKMEKHPPKTFWNDPPIHLIILGLAILTIVLAVIA